MGEPDLEQLGGVILVGGQSSRMGRDKSQLELNGSKFLHQIFRRIASVVGPIVLVGSKSQQLENAVGELNRIRPAADISFANDQHKNCGPLEGIRVGLKTLQPRCAYGFVISCDAPLIMPEIVRFLFGQIEDYPAIVPCSNDGKIFGMTAIYQTRLHSQIGQLIAQGELRVAKLATHFDSKLIDIETLKTIDRRLDSFANINRMEDYLDLLRQTDVERPPGF